MADAPSFDDLVAQGRAEMIILRPDLLVDPGDISEMIMYMGAAMADRAVQYYAATMLETFFAGAKDAALDLLIEDHIGLTRQAAVQATGTITLSRSDLSNGAGTVTAGTEFSTTADASGTDYRFTSDADVSYSGVSTGFVVAVTAITPGRDSNVTEDSVVRIVDTLADPNFSISASTQMAGGAPIESNSDYRQRARDYPGTLRRGTLAALSYGALQVASVAVATPFENDVSGEVTVYVSDVDGNSSLQMIADVEAELLDWRCAGSFVSVAGGVPFLQDVDYSLNVRAGTDTSSLTTAISAAINGVIEPLGIGETLYRSKLQAAIEKVDPLNILNVIINTPSADITPAESGLIRTGTVTIS